MLHGIPVIYLPKTQVLLFQPRMQNSPNSPRPIHARQFGPTQAAVQSPAVQNVVDQIVPALLERHPVHTFDGTAPAPDSVVVIDPGKIAF